MLLVKEKQITLAVSVCKKTPDIIISVTIPITGIADCCIKRLKFNCDEMPALMKGSEEAALAFALFETVRDKLTGSGLEIFKNKVSNIDCISFNNSFTITFNTQGTGTSLRKTCGIMLNCLNTSKLFTKYSENIKFLSNKGGKKEEFNFISKKFTEAIKKSIDITAVGKINTDVEKLKDIINTLVSKLPTMDIALVKEMEAPPNHAEEVNEKSYPVIVCKGISTAIVADYIRNNSNGMSIGIIDEGVIVYNYGWETKHKQLNDKIRIKDYIHKKYKKLEEKDELSAIFAYYSLTQGFIDATVARQIITSKLKTSELVENLQVSMKM